MDEPGVFDHVVALGYNCRVAYNLRRTFGFKTAYPFDWWVTPLPALAAFLHDPSLDRLYDPALLEPVIKGGGIHSIHNAHYRIQMEHEFPKLKNGFVRDDWIEFVNEPRTRTDYLLRRMREIPAGSRVLFVRWTKRMERRELGERFEPLMRDVLHGLEQMFPAVRRSVLLVDPPVRIEAPGVMAVRIPDPIRDWKGTPELWTKALLGMGLERAGFRPGSILEVSPEDDHRFVQKAVLNRRARAASRAQA